MVHRRRFIISGFTSVVLTSARALGQQISHVVKIGWLSTGSPTTFATRLSAFRVGLRDAGFADDVVFIEQRWAEGNDELLPGLAAELARQRLAVIVSVGTPATLAAKRATSSVPIVMVAVGDPVGTGIVSSLARPGGNITGVSNLAGDLSAKLLYLLREVAPNVRRVAVLKNPGNPSHVVYEREIQEAATSIGLTVYASKSGKAEELAAVFAAISRSGAGALIVLPDPLHIITRARIAELALAHRLPSMFAGRDYTEAGGLMSYGPDTPALYRSAATYVSRILKGMKPADTPIEQPTKFELVINMRTAKGLSLTMPPSLLLRADHVIE